MRRLPFFLALLLSLHASAAEPALRALELEHDARATSLWYQRTPAGEMHPAWFEANAGRLELRVLEHGVLHAAAVRFDDGGFLETAPEGPARRWQADGLAWRAPDGTQLIPAWVIPAGRGPGH